MLQNYQDRIKGNTEQQKKVDFTLGIVANKEKFDLLFCLSSRRTQKSKPRANLKKGIIKESPLQLRWNPKRSLLFGSQVELEINLPLYSANSYCLIVQKIKALYLRKKKKLNRWYPQAPCRSKYKSSTEKDAFILKLKLFMKIF